jgi:hypothetical protein
MSDAINQALSSPAMKSATQVGTLGSSAYNLYNSYQNQQYQNQLRSYAQDPAKMNAYAEKFTKPLTAGLTNGVTNNTQAYLAQRGLSESPQISQQVESQAIAPYIQQNQQDGYNNALQALNLGGGANQSGTGAALAKAFSTLGSMGSSGSTLHRLLQLANSGATPQQTQVDAGTSPIAETPTESMSVPTYTDAQPAASGAETYTPDYIGSYGLGS